MWEGLGAVPCHSDRLCITAAVSCVMTNHYTYTPHARYDTLFLEGCVSIYIVSSRVSLFLIVPGWQQSSDVDTFYVTVVGSKL